MSEIRYDRLHDIHVIISPERLNRPDCNYATKEVKVLDKECPFCEGNEKLTPPEIFAIRDKNSYVNEKGWQTRVVPNLYKAVQIEAEYQHHFGLFEHWEGFGAHEVIIDTPKHYTSMIEWSKDDAVAWMQTLRARVADLRKDYRIAYISLFKNEGVEAGSTQMHSHTQLIGLPILPKVQRDAFHQCYEHYKDHGEALVKTILTYEEEDTQRVIAKGGEFIAYCPYASAYPFEVIISSKVALGQIDTLSDESIEDLAPLLLSVLKKMKIQLGCFDFNLSIATPPLQEGSVKSELLSCVDEAHRFAIRIMPRIYKYGGFEQSSGMMINPVSPELAAKLIKGSNDA